MIEKRSKFAIALVLVTRSAMLAWWLRRHSWMTAAGLFGGYLVVAQIMAWLAMHDFITHEMMLVYGSADPASDLVRAIAASAALFIALLVLQTLVLPRGPVPAQMSDATSALAADHRLRTFAWLAAIAWLAALATVSWSLDWSRLWFTPIYLELTDPAVMTNGSGVSALALAALPPIGAVAAATTAIIFGARKRVASTDLVVGGALASSAMLTMLWLMAAHSRAAALPPLAFLLAAIMTQPPHRAWRMAAAPAVLAVLAIAGALVGRGHASHGFASLGALPDLLSRPAMWAPQLAVNLTEGMFATASGLGEWSKRASGVELFPATYILRSFSPLPSAIDGFSDILHAQVRLHDFAPMPGYVELAWFGLAPALAFAGLVALTMAMSGLARRQFPLVGRCSETLLAACLYLMAAYPVRTSLKMLWLSLGLSLLAMAMRLGPQFGASDREAGVRRP